MRQTVILSVYGTSVVEGISMLGHLVFGRYMTGSEQQPLHADPAPSGFMRRVLALFRRR
jgi:hypothetical protein